MMLSGVDQTRQFSTSAGFQWTHLLNNLFVPVGTSGVIANGSDAVQVGPFAAAYAENPLLRFIPIQGDDFAKRFESSLRDQLSLFLEDERWSAPPRELEELFQLLVQSLDLKHGDELAGGRCRH